MPESLALLRDEIGRAKGAHPALDAWMAAPLPALEERNARRLTEQLALALAASLLLRHAPSSIASAYCATRLAHGGGDALGTLPEGIDFAPILTRAMP
jgi:putative acyl-CoA dehydrogenase